MKVFFDKKFYESYTHDPAAEPGRIESIVNSIESFVEFEEIKPAARDDILLAHSKEHINNVVYEGLYPIAALSAGGAIQAAKLGLTEPCFALIRPPGHHASYDSCWGFCYFNNMAIALKVLKRDGKINSAFVLDFDLHFGDGNVNILAESWVSIYNPPEDDRDLYMQGIKKILSGIEVDIIGISAGFDNHVDDWGGLLTTEDYFNIGAMAAGAARACNGGCFAILEGGYNHVVLGHNVKAFLKGMES